MDFKVIVLGSNSAIPKIDSFSSSHLVYINSIPYLVDCCEGVQIQLNRFFPKFTNIEHIFISHLHGDHYFGIFGLISTLNLQNRTKDLHIYADPWLEKILSNEYSPIQISNLTYKIFFHHLKTDFELIISDKNTNVYAFALNHKIKTWGFLFKEKEKKPNIIKDKIAEFSLSIEQIKALKNGEDIEFEGKKLPNNLFTVQTHTPRSYAYCSDTAFCQNLPNYFSDIDLLYHETTFLDEQKEKALIVAHSTPSDAAKAAISTKSKNLLIGHFSISVANKNYFLQQTAKLFSNTILASDGLEIQIDKNHNIIKKFLT